MNSEWNVFIQRVKTLRKLINLSKLKGLSKSEKKIWLTSAQIEGKMCRCSFRRLVKSGVPKRTVKEVVRFVC